MGWLPPQKGELGGVSGSGQNSSSSNVPENIHTKFQDNLTKFQDFGILGGSPPLGGEGGGGEISENRQNSSSSNAPENIYSEFQDNLTKF